MQNHQCLLDTARRMNHLPSGAARLEHQRRTDPTEQQRQRETIGGIVHCVVPPPRNRR